MQIFFWALMLVSLKPETTRQKKRCAAEQGSVFHIDEYIGLSAAHGASFRKYYHQGR
jgi:hypothetical protein